MAQQTNTVEPTRLRPWLIVAGICVLLCSGLVSVLIGPADLSPKDVILELLSKLPFVSIRSGLSPLNSAIVWQIRAPRIVLAAIVGAMLAVAGSAYQGVFRNPLADPYLLGVASGAGLGATIAIATIAHPSSLPFDPVPLAAFSGAIIAVGATYALGRGGTRLRNSSSLILAGVAVGAFFTAIQTYEQQRSSSTLTAVYSWILGGLSTASWQQVTLVLPYVGASILVLFMCRRLLDVMSVGDEEANSLGVSAKRVRLITIGAATLGTAAVVAVSGLIGFVGIIVPHTIRLLVGPSYRRILPLAIFGGAAFLILADLVARTVLSPAEVPIGVVTAFVGAPFFLIVLRQARQFP